MTDQRQKKIGFIGLGLMGAAMVSRLQDLGYAVTVLGRTKRTAIEAAIKRGAVEANNARELAETSDVVMLCVDTSASVESLMFGSDGIVAGVKPGSIVVDFGTSMPASSQKIGAELESVGAHFLDAPLGRTPAHAYDGLLNIMAAGKKSDFDKLKPILKDLGENVFHVGALGAGHTLKLINNFFGMTLATAMSEAFALADQAGIARQDLYNIMSAGPLHSAMMDFVKANAVDGDPSKLAFSIANANKDLGYYTQMTEDLGSPSFIGGATKAALSKAVDQGYGDKDVPVMVDFIAATFSKPKRMMTHEDLAVEAVALVRPSIDALFQRAKRKELHIVIMDPRIKPWEAPFEEAILYEESIQTNAPWDLPFAEVARNKAQQAWRESAHNVITQTQHPSSLHDDDVPFYGSFVYGNVVVACSGLEQWFDMLVSGWIALSFEQLMIHQIQSKTP